MEVTVAGSPINFLWTAVFNIFKKWRQGKFSLIENKVVHLIELIRLR